MRLSEHRSWLLFVLRAKSFNLAVSLAHVYPAFSLECRYLHTCVYCGGLVSRRFLEKQGIPKGIARGLAVFILAYVVSWASGEVVDFIQQKIEGPQAATKLDLGMPIDL